MYIYVFSWIEKLLFHWLHILDFQMLSIETRNLGKKNGNVVRTYIFESNLCQRVYVIEKNIQQSQRLRGIFFPIAYTLKVNKLNIHWHLSGTKIWSNHLKICSI